MKSKRPFILVEVLVAIALVALCAYPLLVPHYRLAGRKVEALHRLQLEQTADQLFCMVQEMLYEGDVQWSELIKVKKGKPRAVRPLGTRTVFVANRQEEYLAKASITVDKMHNKDKRKYFRLFDVAITLKGKTELTYHYFLYGERLGPSS